MLRRHYSLILMALWLVIGVCLVAPGILPDKMQQHLRVPSGGFVGVLAFLFAVYNFARWWAFQTLYRNRAAARAVNPLSVRKVEEAAESYEPNPELNFIHLPDSDEESSGRPDDAAK